MTEQTPLSVQTLGGTAAAWQKIKQPSTRVLLQSSHACQVDLAVAFLFSLLSAPRRQKRRQWLKKMARARLCKSSSL
jgi:hypothetical protein